MKGAAWRDFKAIVGRDRPDRTFRTEQTRGATPSRCSRGGKTRAAPAPRRPSRSGSASMVLDAETFLPLGAERPVVAKAPARLLRRVASLAGTLGPGIALRRRLRR
jgi:hypothetical protein